MRDLTRNKRYIPYLFLFLTCLIGSQVVPGQARIEKNFARNISSAEVASENLLRQVNEFIAGQREKNVTKVTKYIYTPNEVDRNNATDPNLIAAYRKRNAEKLIAQIKTLEFLFTYEETVIWPSEIVTVGKRIFSVVSTAFVTKGRAVRCEKKRFWLGISQDKGRTWGFFPGDSSFQKTFESYFPDASKQITLPEKMESDCSDV